MVLEPVAAAARSGLPSPSHLRLRGYRPGKTGDRALSGCRGKTRPARYTSRSVRGAFGSALTLDHGHRADSRDPASPERIESREVGPNAHRRVIEGLSRLDD